MLQALSRSEFLRLVGLKSATLDQRMLTGQIALALGCQRPAHIGEYLVLDAVAIMLTSMLAATGLELKPSADAVRAYGEEWLDLVTRAEREPILPLFFAVAVLSRDMSHRVAVGRHTEITAALGKAEPLYTVSFVQIQRVLNQLRANAKLAKPEIVLPRRFTVAPDESGYDAFRADIAAYQARAGARFRAKAKAKGQRIAPTPARQPLLTPDG